MNLDDFISETLVNIVNGVETANKQLTKKPFRLPNTIPQYDNAFIDFDVALSVTSTGKGGGEGGFKLGVFHAALHSEGGTTKENVSRAKFKIMVQNMVGLPDNVDATNDD